MGVEVKAVEVSLEVEAPKGCAVSAEELSCHFKCKRQKRLKCNH